MIVINGGHAADAVIDHELEHPGQFRVGANVDEL
jgi:hypothetical protein